MSGPPLSKSEEPIVVVDATVLINFKNVGRLDLLEKSPCTLWCPREVWNEVVSKAIPDYSAPAGFGRLRNMDKLVVQRIEEPKEMQMVDNLLNHAQYSLDPGEAEALTLCLVHSLPLASDDKAARRFARSEGVHCTGTLGFLFTFIDLGVLSLNQACTLHEVMQQHGYFSYYNNNRQFIKAYRNRKQ